MADKSTRVPSLHKHIIGDVHVSVRGYNVSFVRFGYDA